MLRNRPSFQPFQPDYQPDFQGQDDASLEGLYTAFPQLKQQQMFADASTGAAGEQMSAVNTGTMNAMNQGFEGFKQGIPAIKQQWDPWFNALEAQAGGREIRMAPSRPRTVIDEQDDTQQQYLASHGALGGLKGYR